MSTPISQLLQSKDYSNVNNVKKININNVKTIAQTLVAKLNDPGSYKFFCKVAWQLPEYKIWSNLEQAMNGRNPKAYFTFLCKMELP